MRRIFVNAFAFFLAFLVCAICSAQEPWPGQHQEPREPAPPPPPPPPPPPAPLPPAPKPSEPQEPDNSPPDQKAIDAAVKKGVEWLAKRQEKDGSFKGQYGRSYSMGTTALALLAMLKSGVSPRSAAIRKGFAFLEDVPLTRMYSVAIYVMALEALYAPTKKQMKRTRRSYTTVLRENLRNKSQGHDRNKISKLLEWIVSHQQQNVWRYPTGGEDLSNTQYALLALYSGLRMGYSIKPEVFRKAADYLIVNQLKEGPEVKWFPVPAADFSVKDLKKLEKEIREKLRESASAARDDKDKTEGLKGGPRTSVIEDPYSRFGVERREHKMFARGWSYTAPKKPKQGQKSSPQYCTGSMTTAGLACSVIVKAGMEGSRAYSKGYKELINRCIRNGAAWVSKYFMVDKNPSSRSKSGSTSHLYYYLYGLERAGVLTLCVHFGEHDWYNRGAKFIIKEQKPEGYWEGVARRAPKPKPGQPPPPPPPPEYIDTCFALLFLKRATVPVISIPPELYTGGDLFRDKAEKKEQPEKTPPAPEKDKKKPGQQK